MYIHNINPTLIDLNFIEIRWYSLAYIFGILIGWWYGKKIIKFRSSDESTNDDISFFDDLISYIIISIILGGRLGYVIFYNLSYYLNNPIKILKIWEGGMSFHGALLGIIISTYLFSVKKNIPIFFLLDIIAYVSPIGIFFGRIANFINSELYGKVTEVPWAVIFIQIDTLTRHPSQLYEAALEGVILFSILIYFRNKKFLDTPGLISSIFLIFYSIFRIIIEFFRVPDQQLGYMIFGLSMGQIISIIFIIFGTTLFYFKNENKLIK